MQTKLKSTDLTVTINSFGAEICSVKNNKGLEFVWQADKDIWARHAPVLFPVVGKLKDNFFTYKEKKYELPQHGFARDMEFELKEKNETSCTFQLRSNQETKNKFPFDFIFEISYLLEENKLTTIYKTTNPSNETIFFSVGAHPGFNCPLLPSEKFEDYYLEFERSHFSQTQLNNGLRTDAKQKVELQNNKTPLTKTLFDKDALVFENNQINAISLCSSKSGHKITLQCAGWPYFGIWSKKGNTNFICLEPWQGITDHENATRQLVQKDGIIPLAANTEFKCAFSLIFS